MLTFYMKQSSALRSMVPVIIGDRAGLWDEYAATNRLPSLWFKNDTTFMVSTGVDNLNYFQTFYPYEIGKKYTASPRDLMHGFTLHEL